MHKMYKARCAEKEDRSDLKYRFQNLVSRFGGIFFAGRNPATDHKTNPLIRQEMWDEPCGMDNVG